MQHWSKASKWRSSALGRFIFVGARSLLEGRVMISQVRPALGNPGGVLVFVADAGKRSRDWLSPGKRTLHRSFSVTRDCRRSSRTARPRNTGAAGIVVSVAPLSLPFDIGAGTPLL